MRSSFYLFSLLCLSSALRPVLAQSITKQFTITPFDRVQVSSALDVEIHKGPFDVVADLPPGETKYLSVVSEGGVLKARLDRPAGDWLNGNRKRRSPRLIVTMPVLKGITLSGAADGEIEDAFQVTQLDVDLSGASDLNIKNLTADRIKLKASGASDTQLRGKARILEADLSGASDLSAYDLTVDEAIVRAQGASDAQLTVNKRLEKHTRGGADVSHRGNPSTIVSNRQKGNDDD